MLPFSRLLAVFALLELSFSESEFGMRLTTEKSKSEEEKHYRFQYYVKDDTTGDYKTQEEAREGDSVHGSYSVGEPNGDLRTVIYKAGPGRGFEATVAVRPSGSPTKHVAEATTVSETAVTSNKRGAKTNHSIGTVESTVKHFPGGFVMDILSKPHANNLNAKMGIKFSTKRNNLTQSITETGLPKSSAVPEGQTADKHEMNLTKEETSRVTLKSPVSDNVQTHEAENFTFPAEGREITVDPIEKELNQVINSMPKLPELILSDNETHLKFYKDPEEALIDERITEIARQLAETSLRREYEEQKLGHFIPISVRPTEYGSPSFPAKRKSFEFKHNDVPNFKPTPSESAPLQVVSELKIVPQYIFKEILIPNLPSVRRRLPAVDKPPLKPDNLEEPLYETITNLPQILKNNKSENQIKEINRILLAEGKDFSTTYETTDQEPISLMPVHVPSTFVKLFLPKQRYVMQRSFANENKPRTTPFSDSLLVKEITTAALTIDKKINP